MGAVPAAGAVAAASAWTCPDAVPRTRSGTTDDATGTGSWPARSRSAHHAAERTAHVAGTRPAAAAAGSTVAADRAAARLTELPADTERSAGARQATRADRSAGARQAARAHRSTGARQAARAHRSTDPY